MNRLSLVLILHAHQPIGNFDSVIEQNYQKSYLPFLDCFERHPGVCVNLHYSGVLLEWLEHQHPEYLERLRQLREAGRVEFLAGGFYEPVLISIPEWDRQAQIGLLRDYVRDRFGETPRGLWLTERVWEPALPETLADAGMEYTVADDMHFLCGGVNPDQLYGYYETESLGRWIKVLPGLKILRYVLPWKSVPDALGLFARAAETHPNGLMAMGDDLEKFGGWPQTYEYVYQQGWLERFFSTVEENHSWLECPLASDYLKSHEPQGRVYFPTASYREMSEWTLPPDAARIFEEALNRIPDLQQGEAMLRFLNGGTWRNFFAKYSESDLLNKQILGLSERFQRIKSSAPAEAWRLAHRDLLRAQCNDAYWHGVFGGLYSPHLRHALYSSLIRAETALEGLEKSAAGGPSAPATLGGFSPQDPLIEIRSERVNCLIQPSDGATVPAIHFKPSAANLVNSLRRRREAYHQKLRAAGTSGSGVQTIHDRVQAKEEGLERFLLYDRYNSHAFRLQLFPTAKTFEQFRNLQLEESPEWAAARYSREASEGPSGRFRRTGPFVAGKNHLELSIQKEFRLTPSTDCDRLTCELKLENSGERGQFSLGLEVVLNLLAGHAPDRFYSRGEWKQMLDWEGELTPPGPLALEDGWLQLRLTLSANPTPARWWLAPIFSVSQSEGGFERVYQGSRIMPVWDLDLAAGGFWNISLEMTLRSLAKTSQRPISRQRA